MDASSALAIASRAGLGKIRYMEVKFLWLQQLIASRRVVAVKVPGKSHTGLRNQVPQQKTAGTPNWRQRVGLVRIAE
eukprot:2467393-Amphidinium_carterae.1